MSRVGSAVVLVLMVWVSGVHPLSEPDVCIEDRLVVSTSVYSPRELKSNCEGLGFERETCNAVRDGVIAFDDVFVQQSFNVCCDGSYLDGDTCIACPEGKYGRNCTLFCQCLNEGLCDPVSGACSCPDGWSGDRCEERCPANHYGPSCTLPCQSTCKNGGVCHPSLGHCLCDFGWHGDMCQYACSIESCRIESDLCSNDATFDPAGFCMCSPGWQGRYCTEPCTNQTHGTFCDESCRCQNDGLCDWEDGSCLCPPGFSGMSCETRCQEGFYGQDCSLGCDCPEGMACDPEAGTCLECPLGFMGPRCTEQCPPGYWGLSCSEVCKCDSCDGITGKCYEQSSSSGQARYWTTPSMPSITQYITTVTVHAPFRTRPWSNSSSFDSTNGSFLAPLIISLLLTVVVVLLITLVVRNRCKHRSRVRTEKTMQLTHQYAGYILDKEESDYAEIVDIDFGYEIPNTVALDKPGSSTSQPTRPLPEVNYYQTPRVMAPSSDEAENSQAGASSEDGPMSGVTADKNGYLHLNGGYQPPPEYQTIITQKPRFFLR